MHKKKRRVNRNTNEQSPQNNVPITNDLAMRMIKDMTTLFSRYNTNIIQKPQNESSQISSDPDYNDDSAEATDSTESELEN
ncbi:hypothetical protein M0813_09903 [Anaeramoeba flamelloides]|nr:hypothetical protein M0813_09903 [Anaeramoeba flamelloides]